MPLRTIRDETHATFAFSGAGWASAARAGSYGGTVQRTTAAGNTCAITLPANHTFTGGVIYGYGWGDGAPDVSISVDGVVVQAAWNQKFGTSVDANYIVPRILSYPFVLNPAKGTTQVILITAGTGTTRIDGMELYQASAPVAGRLVRSGMSMEYPVIDGSTLGPNTSGHGQLFLAYLSATKYLGNAAWTDVNQAVPSEDLTNGHASSGLAGGPNSAPLYTQFANVAYYPNTAIFTPGWMRLEAGDLWPSPAPALGSALFTTNTQYMAGVAQWWAQLGQYYLLFHNYNDGYGPFYDNPPDDAAGTSPNGAAARRTVATITAGSPAPTTTFTITDGTHPATISVLSDIPSMQSSADAAGFPYTFVSSSGHGTGVSALAIAGDVVTITEKVYGASALSITANANNGGVALATTTAGRNKAAAGAGYQQARYVQRMREALIRLALAITPTPRCGMIGYPNNLNGAPMPANGVPQQYDAAVRAILDEPWILAVTGGAPFYLVPIMAAMTGHQSNVSGVDAHQNNQGHLDIYGLLVRAHEAALPSSYAPVTSYRSGV